MNIQDIARVTELLTERTRIVEFTAYLKADNAGVEIILPNADQRYKDLAKMPMSMEHAEVYARNRLNSVDAALSKYGVVAS